jgi:hypothetical protein
MKQELECQPCATLTPPVTPQPRGSRILAPLSFPEQAPDQPLHPLTPCLFLSFSFPPFFCRSPPVPLSLVLYRSACFCLHWSQCCWERGLPWAASCSRSSFGCALSGHARGAAHGATVASCGHCIASLAAPARAGSPCAFFAQEKCVFFALAVLRCFSHVCHLLASSAPGLTPVRAAGAGDGRSNRWEETLPPGSGRPWHATLERGAAGATPDLEEGRAPGPVAVGGWHHRLGAARTHAHTHMVTCSRHGRFCASSLSFFAPCDVRSSLPFSVTRNLLLVLSHGRPTFRLSFELPSRRE